MKNRGGRPPKPPEERLSEILRFRATARETDRIYRKAIRRGQTTSEFLRSLLGRALETEDGT